MKRFFLTVVIVLTTKLILAQVPQESRMMTLEECMAYAVENSFMSQRSQRDADNLAVDYNAALLQHLPSVSGNVGSQASFGRGIDPATNTYVNESSLNTSFQASGSVPIFYGFQLLNTTRSAKIAKLRGMDQLQRVRDEVAEQTMIAYAEVVYNTELVHLYARRIENYQLEQRKMSRMLELGGGSQADLAQIDAKLASEQFQSIRAKNNLDISIIKLKDCMNYPLEDNLEIVPLVEQISSYNDQASLENIVTYAMEYHPTSLINQKMLEEQRLQLSIVKGDYWPSLSLNGGVSSSYFTQLANATASIDPFNTQLKNNLGEWVGASISIPIFGGLERRYNVKKAKNDYEQAKRDYSENQRALESSITQAVLELEALDLAFAESVRNVDFQMLANQAIRKKYQEGAANIIETQTSDNELFNSELEMRNAYLRYQLKLREVNYYKGIPYINAN